MSLQMEAFEDAGGSGLGVGMLIYIYIYGHWSLIHQSYKFWLSMLTLKVQEHVFLSVLVGALEEDGGSRMGYGIFILIPMMSLVFIIPII